MTAKGVVIYSTTGLSDGWVSFQWCLNDIMAIEKDNIEIIYNCKWHTLRHKIIHALGQSIKWIQCR